MRFVAGAATDVGRVREGNEDSFVVDDRLRLFAVADGMGGHRAGEVASATAVEALRASVASGSAVDEAIRNANAAVLEKSGGDDDLSGMGTTITAVVSVGPSEAVIGHVGDSRAYLLHEGELSQITDDHSLVEELVREGRLTPEQAEAHPQRSIITRALGIEQDVDVDTYTVKAEVGDRVLLCSDGLTTMVRSDDIASILRREPHPGHAAEQLVDAANEAGGEDNITAVVLDVVESDAADSAIGAAAAGTAAAGTAAEGTAATSAGDGPEDDRSEDNRSEDNRSEDDRSEDDGPDGDGSGGDEPAAAPRKRRRWLRAVLVAVPVVVIVTVAVLAVGWYARRTYYVAFGGENGEQVVLYQGRPGGLLGWDPTVEETTDLTIDDLTAAQQIDFEDQLEFSSRSAADEYLDRVADDVAEQARAATSTTSTTSTTRPTPTTTRSAPPA
ncbi:MAG: Stp1/IreP family PP2C-type Ser/Thr phosphatase [Acidimicrobiia bacterium]|nr:Stp1/IreP family PP2C-type Ser/Thr phosphatase [Acidimicrobiia bacterium]